MDESTIIGLIAEKLNCKNLKYGFYGFGDDAYVVPPCYPGEHIVQSTDSFVEGTHFTKDMGYLSVGWKSLVASISDVYAMGANPSFYSLNLIIPKTFCKIDFYGFLEGLKKASTEYKVKLLGGDVVRGGLFSVIIQASGYQRKEFIKTNNGAAKGDVLMTNARLGHGLLGFKQFERNILKSEFIKHFLFPELNQDLGMWLAMLKEVTSLTDISDGLYKELSNMCGLSGCSLKLESLFLERAFKEACEEMNLNPEVIAIQGGEEYGLLWTVKPDCLQDFLKRYRMRFKTKPYLLGRVEAKSLKKKISYENQDLMESITPFEHFTS